MSYMQKQEKAMISGKVKWFNKTKGYGFICPDDGSEDVFIHVTILEKTGMRHLEETQNILFETEIKNGRLRAISIELPEENADAPPEIDTSKDTETDVAA